MPPLKTQKERDNTTRPDLLGNKYAVGNKGGRPRKWQSPEQLETLANQYFEKCEIRNKPITVSGLCYALNTDRTTLYDYLHNYEDEFTYTVKRLKSRIETSYEENMLDGTSNATGSIFTLKNNFGWRDQKQSDTQSEAVNVLAGVISKLAGTTGAPPIDVTPKQ